MGPGILTGGDGMMRLFPGLVREPDVAFGGASNRATPSDLSWSLRASTWYIACGADAAGDRTAEGWRELSPSSRRVRPPGGHKDWADAFRAGVDLQAWWSDLLSDAAGPAIVIPRDRRSSVASWPPARWSAWRARSLELQPASPTADDIRAADPELALPTPAN